MLHTLLFGVPLQTDVRWNIVLSILMRMTGCLPNEPLSRISLVIALSVYFMLHSDNDIVLTVPAVNPACNSL